MKNVALLFISIFVFIAAYAQDRTYIRGKLLYKGADVVAANVVNNTAQTNTITDENGEFEIAMAVGDEIIFSSVQHKIQSVVITPEIVANKRLVVTVNRNINVLDEVIVTPENAEKFLDLKEEEFRGFNYERDKFTRLVNRAISNGQLTDGINFVNIAKMIVQELYSKKSEADKKAIKTSEVLPLVFEQNFFEQDLGLKQDQITGFLEYIDEKLPSQRLLQQSQRFQLIDYLIDESGKYKASIE